MGTHLQPMADNNMMSILKPGYTLLLLILVPQLILTQSISDDEFCQEQGPIGVSGISYLCKQDSSGRWYYSCSPLACGFSSKKHGYYCSYEKNTDKCREYLSCYITASGDCATRDVPEALESTSTALSSTAPSSDTTTSRVATPDGGMSELLVKADGTIRSSSFCLKLQKSTAKMSKCGSGNKFQWVFKNGLLRSKSSDKCLAATGSGKLEMKNCNEKQGKQKFIYTDGQIRYKKDGNMCVSWTGTGKRIMLTECVYNMF